MRVLLVHPPLTGKERYGKYAESGSYLPPLGLCYIAAVLEKEGVDVRIVDGLCLNLTIEDVLREIGEYRPDMVGLSAYSIACERTRELARRIKEQEPVPVVIGGPHVTVFGEEVLQDDCFDVAVFGEGEYTTLELVRALEEGREDLGDIQGIAFRRNGGIVRTPDRGYIQDLDSLPFPARHLLPPLDTYHPTPMVYRRRPVTSMVSSRGCPFQCIFCERIMGEQYRVHSAERVVNEMEDLVERYGIKEFTFYEDNFAVSKERVFRICELLHERGLRVSWSCEAHANVLTRDTIGAMKEAGCWLLSIGIESGDQRVLDFIQKGTTLERIRRVVGWCDEAGIRVRGYFMIGNPTETRETIRRTIDFAKSLPLHTVNFCLIFLNRGSKLYDIARQYGEVDMDPSLVTGHPGGDSIGFVPDGLSREYLVNIQKRAYREFYLRPAQVLRMMRDLNSAESFRRYYSMARTFARVTWPTRSRGESSDTQVKGVRGTSGARDLA